MSAKKKQQKVDPLAYNPEEVGKEQEEIIPDGKQLFTIYNMWFGKIQTNPSGAKRSTDFRIPLNIKFKHEKTGLLLTRLDNGQDEPWNRVLNLQRIGNVDTRAEYHKLMEKIGAPEHKVNGGVAFHIMRDGQRMFTPFDDSEVPGPIGMPVKLNIIHKEVPVMKLKPGAEKNKWGRYEKDQMEQVVEDGKVVTKIQEYVECTQPADDSWKEKAESGWPVLYDLTAEEKKVRGEYFVRNDDSVPEGAERTEENAKAEQKVDW